MNAVVTLPDITLYAHPVYARMTGTKISAAQNMIASVNWLETPSQTVRLAFGTLEEGITKGNIEAPAVPITPDSAMADAQNAIPVRFAFSSHSAPIVPAYAAVIVLGTWGLFRQSLHLLFDGVPERVDLHAVRALLEALPGVARVHDLHVWAMGTSEIAMTAHLVMPQGHADDAFLQRATEELHDRFEIDHVTIQVMGEPFATPCAALAPPSN
jgi:hypothetical protein